MPVRETKDTSSKDPTTATRLDDNQDQATAESSLNSNVPDDPPPAYAPAVVPPPPRTSRGPPKPLCTCPQHPNTAHPAGAVTAGNPSEGTDWGKVLKGTALVAIAAPTLAVAGAAVVLPAMGFASTGVVGGSIAAAVQSFVYGGATCGLFSVLQSVGATIAAPSLLSTAAAAGAAAVGGAATVDGAQKSEEGGEGANGENGSGQPKNAAWVQCACVACVCGEDCECACRRRRRRA